MSQFRLKFSQFINHLISIKPNSSNRILWIDYAKGAAITLVVFRHVTTGLHDAGVGMTSLYYDSIVQIGLSFRMPLFFILSGVFFSLSYKKNGFWGYIHYKFNTIFHPYVIWSVILMSIQIVLNDYVNADFNLLSYLRIFYDPWGHWWFLYALFIVSVLYSVNHKLFKTYSKWAGFFIGLSGVFIFIQIGNYYIFDDIAKFFIYFAIGHILSKQILTLTENRILNSLYFIFILFILTAFFEWLLFFYFPENYYLFFVSSLVGTFLSFGVCIRLARIKSNYILLDVLRIVGQHSLYIYLLHAMTSASIRIILFNLIGFEDIIVLQIIGSIFGILGPIFMYRLVSYFDISILFVNQSHVKFKKA